MSPLMRPSEGKFILYWACKQNTFPAAPLSSDVVFVDVDEEIFTLP